MRPQHQEVFFHTAQQLICCIGLREPNPLSDRWIGQPGCIPKGENCKAKTADHPAHKLAGLVVNPILCPEAFTPATLISANDAWNSKFLHGMSMLPVGFSCIDSGPDKGVVKFHGSRLFADYDLMAINRSNPQGDFVPTSTLDQEKLFADAIPMLNRGFGTPLIQHGAEFMWTGGVGARESEYVLWFGPGRRFNRWPSSMPKGGH